MITNGETEAYRNLKIFQGHNINDCPEPDSNPSSAISMPATTQYSKSQMLGRWHL